MRLGIAEKIAKQFDDEIVFIKGMLASPDTVGSIVPTSRITARCMAAQIDLNSGLPVLELGPGTGVITKAILNHGVQPQDLYCVEYSEEFTNRLRAMLPDVNIINGDAFKLDDYLGDMSDAQFDAIIASMPLLNFPIQERRALILDLLDRIPAGRPIILFSYGATAPVAQEDGVINVRPINWILRNIPPARIWAYSKPACSAGLICLHIKHIDGLKSHYIDAKRADTENAENSDHSRFKPCWVL